MKALGGYDRNWIDKLILAALPWILENRAPGEAQAPRCETQNLSSLMETTDKPVRQSRKETGKVLGGRRGITKSFEGTVAVRDVSFDLRAGEVLAFLGEHGAGKSTCVKTLAGVYHPNSGHVSLGGNPVELRSPLDARFCQRKSLFYRPVQGLVADFTNVQFFPFGGVRPNKSKSCLAANRSLSGTVNLVIGKPLPGRFPMDGDLVFDLSRKLFQNKGEVGPRL